MQMPAMDLSDPSLILLSIALAVVFGLMTGVIARSKGRSFIGWWLYGALSSPIAFFHALLMAPKKRSARTRGRPAEVLRRCPHCGAAIKPDLEVCPQCWRVLPGDGAGAEREDDL